MSIPMHNNVQQKQWHLANIDHRNQQHLMALKSSKNRQRSSDPGLHMFEA